MNSKSQAILKYLHNKLNLSKENYLLIIIQVYRSLWINLIDSKSYTGSEMAISSFSESAGITNWEYSALPDMIYGVQALREPYFEKNQCLL